MWESLCCLADEFFLRIEVFAQRGCHSKSSSYKMSGTTGPDQPLVEDTQDVDGVRKGIHKGYPHSCAISSA
jgi:hypothetical protein